VSAHIRLRPAAERDIEELADYLAAQASLATGLRYRDAVRQTLLLLAEQPELGARFRASNPRLQEVRFWPVRGFAEHVLFYRFIEGSIEVLRVLHGKRDLDAILKNA
jgi:toxin ParE1/3/4